MTSGKRPNGEGSIYGYRNGYAAYVWVTTPAGKRKRKYAYGRTREQVHEKWVELHQAAMRGPVQTNVPTLATYLEYWLEEVVRPGLRMKTAQTYGEHVRLYISPGLGSLRLDQLRVSHVRSFLNRLATECQCCAQGKDARRPPEAQRCCAIGNCCAQQLSRRTVQDVRTVLRSALSNAVTEEMVTKNVAALTKLPSSPRNKSPRLKPWTVEEARRFLMSAASEGDPLYAAFVLILVLGLRRGEVLGLTWSSVDFEASRLTPAHGLQRIGRGLVLGDVKTAASEAELPMPKICVSALHLRRGEQEKERAALNATWPNVEDLVFTTRIGTAIDPRNFVRNFKQRCDLAGVRQIRVHDTRHTCGSLLAELNVHPRVAMQILRHTKIDVTMEIYTHASSDQTRQALAKLAESLEEVLP